MQNVLIEISINAYKYYSGVFFGNFLVDAAQANTLRIDIFWGFFALPVTSYIPRYISTTYTSTTHDYVTERVVQMQKKENLLKLLTLNSAFI